VPSNVFRIVIFTSASPSDLRHFLWRLRVDLPDVDVAGVLYETGRPSLPLSRRLERARRHLGDVDFLRYTASRATGRARRVLEGLATRALRAVHATPRRPNPGALALDELVASDEGAGIPFHVTSDLHDAASRAFVAGLGADLGVIYGTRILKPELFTIPRLGSINIHKHKVPDYRGSGAPGLWELRDGATEQTVTVHRVTREVDAGAVLGERSFPIEPLDTLASVGLKANLVAIDCLVDVIRAESRGESVERPQPAGGRVFKGYQPHQIWAIEREIGARRAAYRPTLGRSVLRLIPRLAALPWLAVRNARRAREKRFPVVVLFHHLVSDRQKFMGMPTDQFLRHVRFLKEHYRIVSLPEAVRLLESGEVDVPTVALTFDDGYAENFLGLRAVVEAENVPVTMFVSTRHVTDRSEFQHDVDADERGFPALSWDEVRYFDRHGVCVASHTRTHFDCGSVDEERLRDEIAGSLEDLRRELGHDVLEFSFPKGHPENMSEPARRIARETYPYVFSASGGVNVGPIEPGAMLKRSCHPESLVELELVMQSLLDFDGGLGEWAGGLARRFFRRPAAEPRPAIAQDVAVGVEALE
jgi:peptidoglycan/xylan/chitin deacetylase (PgdA/CDA1 family)